MPDNLTLFDYQITTTNTYPGKRNQYNIWHYKAVGVDHEAGLLLAQFVDVVVSAMASIMSSACSIIRAYVVNLKNPDNFADAYFTVPGGRGINVANSFVAWGFKYPRPTRLVRDGSKRIGGVSETDITNGNATATALGLLEAAEDAFGEPLSDVLGNEYYPCVAKTYLVPQTGDPTKEKRVPFQLFPVVSVNYERVTHQTSRAE